MKTAVFFWILTAAIIFIFAAYKTLIDLLLNQRRSPGDMMMDIAGIIFMCVMGFTGPIMYIYLLSLD